MFAGLVSRLDEEGLELDRVFENLAVGSRQLSSSIQDREDVPLEQVKALVEAAVEAALDDVEVEGADPA